MRLGTGLWVAHACAIDPARSAAIELNSGQRCPLSGGALACNRPEPAEGPTEAAAADDAILGLTTRLSLQGLLNTFCF